jgi:hypothetical protein
VRRVGWYRVSSWLPILHDQCELPGGIGLCGRRRPQLLPSRHQDLRARMPRSHHIGCDSKRWRLDAVLASGLHGRSQATQEAYAMDDPRFDTLSRAVSATPSRRATLALLAGLGLGALDLVPVEARKSGKCKPKCSECEKCKKGKKGKKGKCQPKAAGAPCTAFPGGACQNGTCVNLKADEANCGSVGTVCTANEVCQTGSCFPVSTCPATQTSVCAPATPCGATECFCGRSREGNVVCVTQQGIDCGSLPTCTLGGPPCPTGSACVDASGCCTPAVPPGTMICMARCPDPF